MGAAESFFYVGTVPVMQEIIDDIMNGLIASPGSLYYNRDYGAGVQDFENTPISLSTLIQLRLAVLSVFARRNEIVTGGQIIKGTAFPDRRAVASQNTVNVIDEGGGNLYVQVMYIALGDLTKPYIAKTPIGGGT